MQDPPKGAPAIPAARFSLQRTFLSLRYPNYRLWFIGQTASLVGTWMQSTALGFLVFQLTNSPAYLGLVGFAAGAPTWIFTLYGGVISDRMSRRTLLLITQTAMMILAFLLAALTFSNLIQPWQIVVLAFGLGVAQAFDAPARQAFVVELVDREDLGNAIALNSTMFNLATATGPAVAGIAYALIGPAWCFTINGLSFIAVIVALALMKLAPQPRSQTRRNALVDLKEAWRYTMAHTTIRMFVLIIAMGSLFTIGFTTLLPAWAVDVLGGNAATNGFLQSARGIGALIGALTIASLGRINYKGKVLTTGLLLYPVALLVWATVTWLPLSLLLLVVVGFSWMLIANMNNVLLQSHVEDQLRGRVMGIYTLAFFGLMPIGSLLSGALAEWAGAPVSVAIGAAIMLIFAVWIWFRMPSIRSLT